jgi:ribosome biogenesis GTPase
MKGLVYKSTGSWYIVKVESGGVWDCRIKGKLKIDEEISSTNPIAVGDIVNFEAEDEEKKIGIIITIEDRKNYIARVSPHNKHQKHIVAANMDAALIMATLSEPRTSTGFVDRFLVTAEAYHIQSIIVINKIDTLKPKHQELLEMWKHIYGLAGYEVYPIVAKDKTTLEKLQEKISNKTVLFSGHSGVGKSTLINQLIPGISLRTQEVSDYSGKGQHTTTFAEMFDLPEGGHIIDTPGVKEFGLVNFEKEELAHYFPEMRERLNDCRFNNCLHMNEPGCAIKAAIANKEISEERYINYITILDSIEKKW